MSGRGRKKRGRRGYGPSGFEEAGGYMAAKISKLQNQYKSSINTATEGEGEQSLGLFSRVAIFVNGYTEPTGEELKRIMMTHGGTYHHYYSRTATTHIIASNLPDSKVKNLNTDRIVSPKWISDSLQAGHLLDYTKYLLYTNQSKSQPRLQFKIKSESEKASVNCRIPSSVVGCTEEKPCVVKPENEDSSNNIMDMELRQCKDTGSDSKDGSGNHSFDSGSVTLSTVKDNKMSKGAASVRVSIPSHSKGHHMSTANPSFLSEFYSNSRLHYISTMGATFKQYVTELQSKDEGFPGQKGLMEWAKNQERGEYSCSESTPISTSREKHKRTIMHVDMDCFFVSVGLRKHPELQGKPVAVTHAKNTSQAQVREGMDRQYELSYYKERAEKKHSSKRQPTMNPTITNRDLEANPFEEDVSEDASKPEHPCSSKFSTMSLIDDKSSMSEIASCNYEARKAGVKNGMFLGPALRLCPTLQTIPYDFEGYKEVSYKLYDVVASFTHDIEAVSCDEMFVDLTELLHACQVTPLQFTTYLRQKVQAGTGCPCSAGLGPNMLVARLATRTAKPNGQHLARPDDLCVYMKDQKVTDLPGVGWSLGRRLEAEGIATCDDLQARTLRQLQATYGSRTGHSLYNYSRGLDDRSVKSEHVRKSVSAEVNYGIRFTCESDTHKFISELAREVERRLTAIKLKGRCITLKLKIRAKDAPVETAKFMGHGVCDNVAKSVTLAMASSSADVIERETTSLLRQVKAHPQDFRGVGIQMSRLEGESGSSGSRSSSIKSFLLGAKANPARKSVGSNNTLLESTKPSVLDASKIESPKKNAKCEILKSGPTMAEKTHPGPSRDHTVSSSSSTRPDGKNMIDMEVLQALPEDMREQVIAEYRQQGYIIPAVTLNDGGGEPRPSTSRELQPSTSREPQTSTSREPRPSTSREPQPSTSREPQPSTSRQPQPSTSREPQPSTSREPRPSTSQEPRPSTSREPQPSISGYCHQANKPVRLESTSSQNSVEYVGSGVTRPRIDDDADMFEDNSCGNEGMKGCKQDSSVQEEKQGIESKSNAVLSLVEDFSHGSSSSSVKTEATSETLITSFSQVDSSFLSAIPEELQEELRQDFQRQKQEAITAEAVAAEAAAAEAVSEGWHMGRRGQWSKTDPRQARPRGLATLMSHQPARTEAPAPSIRRGQGGRKRGRPPKNRPSWQATRSSPTKRHHTHTKPREVHFSPSNQDTVVDSGSSPVGGQSSKDQANGIPNEFIEKEAVASQSVPEQEMPAVDEPKLCGVHEVSEVKLLIREWVLSCSCPEAEDAEILAHFYTSLITHQDLEKLDLLIKYLYRQVLGTHNKRWESTYRAVLERVQATMLERYTVKLKVVPL